MNFSSAYDQGFLRVAACSSRTSIGIPPDNAATVIEIAQALAADGVGLVIFPELCLTGYSIDDLLLNEVVWRSVRGADSAMPPPVRASFVFASPLEDEEEYEYKRKYEHVSVNRPQTSRRARDRRRPT